MFKNKATTLLLAVFDTVAAGKLKKWAEERGWQVLTVSTGLDAISRMKQVRPPGFIVIDQALPDVSGFALCEQLERLPCVPYRILLMPEKVEMKPVAGIDVATENIFYFPLERAVFHACLSSAECLVHEREKNDGQTQFVLDNLVDFVFLKNGEGRYEAINQRAQQLFGISPQNQGQIQLRANIRTDLLKQVFEAEEEAWQKGGPLSKELNTDHEECFRVTYIPRFNPPQAREKMLILGKDVSDNKAFQKQLQVKFEEHYYDAGTGLSTATHFREELKIVTSIATKFRHPISLCRCQINDFDNIREDRGQAAADGVLKEVAAIFRKELRSTDIPGYLGKSDFAMILLDTGVHNSLYCLKRIRRRIKTLQFNGQACNAPFRIAASFGVAELTTEVTHFEDLMNLAEAAMRQAVHERVSSRIIVHENTKFQAYAPSDDSNPLTEPCETLQGKLNYESEAKSFSQMHNHRYFERHLSVSIRQAERGKHALSLCMTRLDNLQKLRGQHGIKAVENAKTRFSQIIQSELRHTDLSAQADQDAFYIAFPRSSLKVVMRCLKRIKELTKNTTFDCDDGGYFKTTASFGCVEYSEHSDGEALLKEACAALTEVQTGGGDGIKAHGADTHES